MFFVGIFDEWKDSFVHGSDDETGEVNSVVWISPQEAMQLHSQGKMPLSPPTAYVLHELACFGSLEQLLTELKARKDNIYPIQPQIRGDVSPTCHSSS